MEMKICAYCGKEFETEEKRRKYCSKECYEKAHKESFRSARAKEKVGKKIKCVVCGKEFIATTVQSKYCSKECSRKFLYQNARAKRLARKSKIACEICGKPLTEYSSYLYCSKECSLMAKRQLLKENSEINRQMAKPKKSAKSKGPKVPLEEVLRLMREENLQYEAIRQKYKLD